jgi:hypothetical protein
MDPLKPPVNLGRQVSVPEDQVLSTTFQYSLRILKNN